MLSHLNRFVTVAAMLLFLALVGPPAANAQSREPFQTEVEFLVNAGQTQNSRRFYGLGLSYQVFDGQCATGACTYNAANLPDNKRMVIENIGVTAKVPSGQMVEIDLVTYVINPLPDFPNSTYQVIGSHPFVPVNKVVGTKHWFVLNQETKLYAHQGTFIQARAIRSATTGVAEIKVIISGYLETVVP